MSERASYDRASSRYVTWQERAEIRALWASILESYQEATPPPEAILPRCNFHFGAFQTTCPQAEACASTGQCWRSLIREHVIMWAYLQVLEMRGR